MRLSHSAITKYKTCPAQYKYHYLDKIRSNFLGSPLLFGNAIDEALNILLLKKKDDLTEEESELIKKDPVEVFDYLLTVRVMNKEIGPEDIRSHPLMQYFASDFEPGVLLDEDWELLETFINNAGYEERDPEELYDILKIKIKDGSNELTDLCYYNYASWLSLRRKGHLMLEVYENEILPKIKKVHSIQDKVSLPNGNGDEIIGYIDFVAELEGEEGLFTIDNKTSGKKYKVSDINDKGQLLLYDEYTNLGQAAYIVLIKKPKLIKHKTCVKCGTETVGAERSCKAEIDGQRCGGDFEVEIEPQIMHQILTGIIDEDKKDLLFDEIGDILNKIEAKEFSQDREQCFQFGKPCPYYNYCRNGSMEGLSKAGK